MLYNLEDREGCDSFPRRGLTGSVCCAVVVMCMRGYSTTSVTQLRVHALFWPRFKLTSEVGGEMVNESTRLLTCVCTGTRARCRQSLF